MTLHFRNSVFLSSLESIGQRGGINKFFSLLFLFVLVDLVNAWLNQLRLSFVVYGV